jgi:5-methylcytosine-specific restriction endonuclease McrA
MVMRRDGFRCRQCGQSPATTPGTILVLDHIQPWSRGGETELENLQTLCEQCNAGKGSLE